MLSESDYAQSLYVRGLLTLRDGDPREAADLLRAALQRQPSHRGMRRNLMRATLAARQFDQALLHADICLRQTPDDPELHFIRGTALSGLNRPFDACPPLNRALALRPDHAATSLNLANASADLDDWNAAERLCRQAIRRDPLMPEAYASLGYILTMRGLLDAAIEACDAAIRLSPDFSQAHWNRATALLLRGDFEQGFAAFEWRKRHAPYRRDFRPLPGIEWRGERLAGETVLVRAEQGAGDTIQFARFLPAIRAAGGSPILACPPALVPLLGMMPGVTVTSDRDVLPICDRWIDLMSLPYVLGTTEATIPAASGYLRADPDHVADWRGRLPAGRRVGVAFAGNPAQRNDKRRSIPPGKVRALPVIQGLAFVNLQPDGGVPGLLDLSDDLTDYAQTAALIECLDLVVTVDTSVAHLAGALGKRAWVLLSAAPDWRWMLRRTDSPWYASIRLRRQTRDGDWHGVMRQVVGDLIAAAATCPSRGGDRHP
jgi:Flp pilus assembly protein TadD